MRMTPNLNEVSTVFSANGTSTHSIFCIQGVCFSMTIHITHHTPFSEAVDAPNAPVVDDGTAHWITQGLSCGQDFRQHMFTLSKKIVGPTCCAWLIGRYSITLRSTYFENTSKLEFVNVQCWTHWTPSRLIFPSGLKSTLLHTLVSCDLVVWASCSVLSGVFGPSSGKTSNSHSSSIGLHTCCPGCLTLMLVLAYCVSVVFIYRWYIYNNSLAQKAFIVPEKIDDDAEKTLIEYSHALTCARCLF